MAKKPAETKEEIRPGEIGAMFVALMGGKESYVKAYYEEFYRQAPGSMARTRLLEMINKDLTAGHEANTGAMEDLDDEALEEVARNTEEKLATRTSSEGSGPTAAPAEAV